MNEIVLKENQISYIITILNNLDWEYFRGMLNFCSNSQPIEWDNPDESKIMLKIIDDFQEIESTITGVPIK